MQKANYCFVDRSFCSSSQVCLVIKSDLRIQLVFKVKSNTHRWALHSLYFHTNFCQPLSLSGCFRVKRSGFNVSVSQHTVKKESSMICSLQAACKMRTRSLWPRLWRTQDSSKLTGNRNTPVPTAQPCRQGLVRARIFAVVLFCLIFKGKYMTSWLGFAPWWL